MKTSFIATVFNEADDIKSFIDSILLQSHIPDEIIIVDAGSKDRTIQILKGYGKKITLLTHKGNRSIGRNFGIGKATGEIILVSDAGCVLDKQWVRHITKPFAKKEVAVVSGYYTPITQNDFEKALATYTSVMPDKLNPETFLPSSRSIAFRKYVWENVGKYPEYLDTCEDLVFAKGLQNQGYKFYFEGNAIVHWRQKSNLFEACKQFYSYAVGDGMALYFRMQTPFLYLRYLLLLLLVLYSIFISPYGYLVILILGILYIMWAIRKNYRYVKNPKAYYYLPMLQFTADFAVMIGTIVGVMKRGLGMVKINT